MNRGRTASRLAALVAGLAAGALLGSALALGAVVAQARFQDVYHDSVGDALRGWAALPAVLGAVAGAAAGWRGWGPLRRGVAWSAAGLAAGVVLGALAGAPSRDPAWTWAGGVMGGAVGAALGAVAAAFVGRRRRRGGRARAAGFLLAAGVVHLLSGCRPSELPEAPPVELEEPDPSEVESVVLLLGDPGLARAATHPVLPTIRREVERWSGALGRDSAVVVVVLGDFVYPDGLRAPEDPGFASDTSVLADQVALVDGPLARRHRSHLVLVAGNHDWGQERDAGGTERLRRVARWLEGPRSAGVHASLRPAPGEGGPDVLDVGTGLRLVMIDTAWWLLDAGAGEKRALVDSLGRVLGGAADRRLVLAAHHPFRSGGPHGAFHDRTPASVIRTLLSRSGAMLQDLHSQPYRDLLRELRAAFSAERAPDLFAAGHEHSLQVLRGLDGSEPVTTLVSGSGSKLSAVGGAPGMRFASSAPGYGRLFVLRDGTLRLFVDAAPPDLLSCPEEPPDGPECMRRGRAAFRPLWAGDLPRPGAR